MFSSNGWFTVPICGSPHGRGRRWQLSLTNEVWAQGTTNGRGRWALSPTLSINTIEKISHVSSGLLINHRVTVLRRTSTINSVHGETRIHCPTAYARLTFCGPLVQQGASSLTDASLSLMWSNSLPSVIGDS